MPTFGVSGLWPVDPASYLRGLHGRSIRAWEIGFNSRIPSTLPESVARLAATLNIKLSFHLPFFLSWADDSKVAQSTRVLSEGTSLARALGTTAVFHLGYYGDRSFDELLPTMVSVIKSALDTSSSDLASRQTVFGIETTGKKDEIGSLEEILRLTSELSDPRTIPIVDWSHLFARSNGKLPRSEDDYRQIMGELEAGFETERFYFHASGIEFDFRGEKRHVSVRSCNPPLPHLLKVLNEGGYEYTLIVESPDPVPDAIWLEEVRGSPEAWIDYAEEKLRRSGLQKTLA